MLEEQYSKDKKVFVEKHLHLLSLCNDLRNLMKWIIFTQFLMSSLNLCVLGFQLVMTDNFLRRILVAIYGLAITIQLFIYAFGGQIMLDHSSSVSDNLFEMDKDLIHVIARVSKPVKMKSAFYTADFREFTSIIRRAGSLITLLQTLVDKIN